jgi:hypothetical protein
MRWIGSRVLWGALLILGGILYLLQNLNILHVGDLFWAIVLLLIGAFFLVTFINDRVNWWALIPGIILVVLGLLVVLNLILPFTNFWTGPLFLAGIGLAFWAVYLNNRAFWWAIIPGGVLFTLALVAGLSGSVPGMETGGIFFLGLGVTFGLLAILPTGEGPQTRSLRWAFIPAIVMVIMGLLIAASSVSLINYIWPALLILGGIYLVYLTLNSRRT